MIPIIASKIANRSVIKFKITEITVKIKIGYTTYKNSSNPPAIEFSGGKIISIKLDDGRWVQKKKSLCRKIGKFTEEEKKILQGNY